MNKDNKIYCGKETDRNIETIILMMLTSIDKLTRQIAKKLINNKVKLKSIVATDTHWWMDPQSDKRLITTYTYLFENILQDGVISINPTVLCLSLSFFKKYFNLDVKNKQRLELVPSKKSKYYIKKLK